ncbi:hypothetical protein QBC37DRAFT_369107 [Rhypophila decipiens]|uniref:Uncharacterized protein n=1 Tax=Rhypophila decipiens TaxID=261697 RepID=A0AAN7BAB6_9PEZI|nr:hypothetical protein QBC37DRAFT_369107 [Rhypophila decipiens]
MAGSGPSGTDSQPERRVSRSKNDRGQYKLEKKTPEEIAKRKRLAAEGKADGKSSKKERSSRNSSAADEPRSNSSSSYACGPWKPASSSSTRKSADSESSHRSSKTSKSSHKKGYAESTTSDASSEMPSQPPRYPVSTEPATNGYYGSPPPVQPMRQFNSPAQHQPNFYTHLNMRRIQSQADHTTNSSSLLRMQTENPLPSITLTIQTKELLPMIEISGLSSRVGPPLAHAPGMIPPIIINLGEPISLMANNQTHSGDISRKDQPTRQTITKANLNQTPRRNRFHVTPISPVTICQHGYNT